MLKYVEDYKEADGYRRVHNYAKNFLGIGYTFQDSTDPRVLENQVPDLFDYLINNGGVGAYRYVLQKSNEFYEFEYKDSNDYRELKKQIIPMFEWIKANNVDIISVSEPIVLPGGRVRFTVLMKRESNLTGILKNKSNGEVAAIAYSHKVGLKHEITFQVNSYQEVHTYEVVFLPSARNTN